MDIKTAVRNPERVRKALVKKGDMIIAKETCKIMIPSTFIQKGLAEFGLDTYVLAIYAMIVEDKYYAVSIVPAMMQIDPSQVVRTMVDGTEYTVCVFEPGDTVIVNTNLVRNDKIIYPIFNEVFSRGRVPWQLSYEDMGNFFQHAGKFAGAQVGTNHEVMEVFVSILARSSQDKTVNYRHVVQSYGDLVSNPPEYIPLRNVNFAATNTISKLAGSYFSEGVISALVSPTTRLERLDRQLRT